MQIQIKNIGLLRNVGVKCRGVTLITGKNGSGKSTFGKALTSLFVGIHNAPLTYLSGLNIYFKENIAKILGLNDYNVERHYYFGNYLRVFRNLYKILNSSKVNLEFSYYNKMFVGLMNELENHEAVFIDFAHNHNQHLDSLFDVQVICSQIQAFREEFEDMFYDSNKASFYIGQAITESLNNAFVGQVKPIGDKNNETEINFEDGDFKIEYSYDNSISYLTNNLTQRNCFYIDDSSIIDNLNNRSYRPKQNAQKFLTQQLVSAINAKLNSVNKVLAREKFNAVFKLLDVVYPYDLILENGLILTTNNGVNIANEASGKKIFALIKQMLYCNMISESSILIFDEPDNHLHPEWQTIFAKLVIELSKATGCKVFCITHSPTLLLAFDVFTKNEDTNLHENFDTYYCSYMDKNIYFKNVTDNIAEAHKALSEPYINLDLFGKESV